ncbi:hypothetical protein BJX66DRAFT_324856 [Aspergillus keveii]|uniref:Zn(2)-C6 fungal-type domain-containing protein n=1 Tax=Aspergillus keveii TaxID=714993 RepID=A0ABR4G932_9EURO
MEDPSRSRIHRTRTGCQTCRTRKVKCDEHKPTCTQCRKGNRLCSWSASEEKRSRAPRRANATACDICREKKLKCIGNVHKACQRCTSLGLECVRTRKDVESDSSPHSIHANAHPYYHGLTEDSSLSVGQTSSNHMALGQLPVGKELEDLVEVYFSSVHHFGFLAFIHPYHFKRLLAKGEVPHELTLMMIASATRFAAPVTPENIAIADAWADAAVASLIPRIYQGYGAVQLMALLLAQHYDMHRGKTTSAYLLGGNCTRMMQMMSLHTFDRTYPADFPSRQNLSPLLSREALRRVAWSTFYLDSMTDGGRYGSQTVDEHAYRIQLPCDESFLGNDHVVTEPLFPGLVSSNVTADNLPHASLDMSAYLLRTAAARRRALHFAFRASHQEQSVDELSMDLLDLQSELEEVFAALPQRFHFIPDNLILHRNRLTTFILLHVLRQNLFIILGRAALQIYLRDPAKSNMVSQVRRNRITRALAVADVVSEGLRHTVGFDPHVGIQAYVALEILLLEPRRLASEDPSINPKASELVEAVTHLLIVIRSIGSRSEFIKHLHLEAIHRVVRCDCTDLLTVEDLALVRSKHPLVGQDAAEYNFADLRGAKMERLRKHGTVSGQDDGPIEAPDEVLLHDSPPPTSPRPDQIETTHNPSAPPDPSDNLGIETYDAMQEGRAWRDLIEPDNADHVFSSLNWLWPFEEWEGEDQIGDLAGFSGLL